ncbi:hypothetical protein L3Y34_015891 [Caenorhabditis briggsae]|uniref:Protein CBR-DPF-3 n=1 Tax=Caenorhabditis briggsae TaxID=6238 RepID=A0AAE9DUX7_CAEBR|nr:hypothetical protein L3Y34_015891 [Caenorhabditis briggsae]
MPENNEAKIRNCTFRELQEHAKKWKAEIRHMTTQGFSKLGMLRPENGRLNLYAISSVPGSSNQTIFMADVPIELLEKYVPSDAKINIKLRAGHNVDPLIKKGAPSAEFAMLCERQRAQVAQGITDYEICNKDLTLVAGDQIFRFRPGNDAITQITVGLPDNQKNEPGTRAQVEPMDLSEGSMGPGTKGCSVEAEHSSTSSTSTSSNTKTDNKPPPAQNFVSSAKQCPSDPDLCAYVLNKQVFIERKGKVVYHTTSNSKHITNGVPSYIIQEELERFEGIWWSDTQTRLLYEHVNEEAVEDAQFGINGDLPSMPMKYPKAGTRNSTSQLRMIVLENGRVYDVGLCNDLIGDLCDGFEYITRAGFFSDGTTVWVQVMNRTQNTVWLLLIPFSDFTLPEDLATINPPCRDVGFQLCDNLNMGYFDPNHVEDRPRFKVQRASVIHKYHNEHWINTHNAIQPLKVEDPENPVYEFIYCLEKSQGSCLTLLTAYFDTNGYNYHTAETSLMAENYSINKSMGIVLDEKRQLVYYVANESHPTEWNVCVSNYRSGSHAQLTESGICFKAERANGKMAFDLDYGFACWMTAIGAAPQCRFYAFRWKPEKDIPETIYAAFIYIPGSPIVPEAPHDVPEMVEYPSKRTGLMHFGMIIRPANFDGSKKYPVFHYVYGGPGIQIVHNDYSWVQFIRFARLGYVVVVLDNRGSAHRGIDFEGFIAGKMGTAEVEDQVEGLQIIAERTGGFMDLKRVVVHGWSYGGYMALQMIAKHPQQYIAAIAGGAVTDWRLYDTAYTERYLGFPVVADIYQKSSIIPLVDKLPDEPNRLMLVHGLMDENVHFSHATTLIDECIKKGKWHELLVFPRERHGIRNTDASVYLDARMMFFAQQAVQNLVLADDGTTTIRSDSH